MKTTSYTGIVLALILTCTANSNADIVSTFDNDLEGWTLPNQLDADFSWQSSGGNPDGYAQFIDGLDNNGNFITAPSVFLGDWSNLNSTGAISFDHNQFDAGTGNDIVPFEIFLSGSGGSARFIQNHPGTIGEWLSVTAILDETFWTVESGTWTGLLNDVSQFDIRIEVVDNNNTLGDRAGIDNIAVVVPEPTGLAFLSVAVLLFAGCYRKRQPRPSA